MTALVALCVTLPVSLAAACWAYAWLRIRLAQSEAVREQARSWDALRGKLDGMAEMLDDHERQLRDVRNNAELSKLGKR